VQVKKALRDAGANADETLTRRSLSRIDLILTNPGTELLRPCFDRVEAPQCGRRGFTVNERGSAIFCWYDKV